MKIYSKIELNAVGISSFIVALHISHRAVGAIWEELLQLF